MWFLTTSTFSFWEIFDQSGCFDHKTIEYVTQPCIVYTTGVRQNMWGNELLGAFLHYIYIYSQIIFVPLLVTHNHQLPPHLPANSRQIPTSHPCCFLSLNPLFCLFLFNSIKSSLFGCNCGGRGAPRVSFCPRDPV